MSNNAITPMIALGVTAYANQFVNSHGTDVINVKPLLFAGVGGLLLTGMSHIPSFGEAAPLIGWLAFTAYLLTGYGTSTSPVANLLKISQGKGIS